MSDLLRGLAPIADAAWREIEAEAKRTLTGMLAARKLVDFDGPLGWDASAISLGRTEPLRVELEPGVETRRRRVQALIELRVPFARGWPGTEKLGAAPWWVWIGGFLGAFYVLGSVVTAPKLGAAALFAFILAGQAVASLAVDHFGWVGFDEDPVTPGRLLGMALVAAGVAAVRFL